MTVFLLIFGALTVGFAFATLYLAERVADLKLELNASEGRRVMAETRRINAERDAESLRRRLLERQGPR